MVSPNRSVSNMLALKYSFHLTWIENTLIQRINRVHVRSLVHNAHAAHTGTIYGNVNMVNKCTIFYDT